MCSNFTEFRLANQLVFGGATALTVGQFHKVNGYSNEYWGWGGEDDDMGLRFECKQSKISTSRRQFADRYDSGFGKMVTK